MTPTLNVLGRTVAMQKFLLVYPDGLENQAKDAVMGWAMNRLLPFSFDDAEMMLEDIEQLKERA